MPLFQFLDHLIPYDTFLNDLAARIVKLLKADHDDPEYVRQRKAYQMFGQGKIVPCKRPGKVEYKTAELRFLQRTVQDYFDNQPLSSITNKKRK